MSGSARRAVRFAILGVSGGGRRRPLRRAWSRLASPARSVKSMPALKPLWLDHVMETKSMLWLAASHPGNGAGGRGVRASPEPRRRSRLWRRQPDYAAAALAAAFVVLAAVLGCWQIEAVALRQLACRRAARRLGGRARAARPRCRRL